MFTTIFDTLTELIAPKKTRLSRLLIMLIMILGIAFASVTFVFSEIKKQGISKSQLEIEKNRVTQIDKQLSNLYEKAYSPNDSSASAKGHDQNYFLKQIEFLKNQRAEAVKNIDDINKNPDTQLLIFTLLAGV